MMLQRGDHVPHFHVKTVGGGEISYSTIWQQRNLLLVTIGDAESTYVADLLARSAEFLAHNSVCVVTRDDVAGLPAPGLLIADRWGEIVHVACAPRVEGLPAAPDLLDWLASVEQRCPECEGEAR